MSSAFERVETSRVPTQSPGISRSIIVSPSTENDLDILLHRVVDVWKVVATWGRWCDEHLGDWPSVDSALNELPEWFAAHLRAEPEFEIDNWMDDLHDRNWVWWNGTIVNDHIKIDLDVTSSPISTWTIEYVIEKAGGAVSKKEDRGPE